MSFGVNATMRLLEYATKIFGKDHDIEIIEAHHKDKVDLPLELQLKWVRLLPILKPGQNDIFNLNRSIKKRKGLMVKLAFLASGPEK